MGKTTNPRKPTKDTHNTRRTHTDKLKDKHHPPPPPPLPPQPQQPQQQQLPSWAVMKSIFTCKHLDAADQKPSSSSSLSMEENSNSKKSKKMKCSGSLCNNTKVMQRPDPPSPEIHQRKNRAATSSSSSSSSALISSHESSSSRSIKTPVPSEFSSSSRRSTSNNNSKSSSGVLVKSYSSSHVINANNCSIKGMPFRRLSGCYECRMVVDPVLAFTRDPSLRSTICTCPHCGEVFMNPDNLDLHQAVRHAVSELGSEDTSKNIVEIIFQSSWLKKQTPVCHIDRILKVHNTQRTISRFEEYRDWIKSKATKQHYPRCTADGNELLRFHCTTFKCSLGLHGSSNLCNSIPHCAVCSIIKSGFKMGPTNADKRGILTTATSGRAHDRANVVEGEKRAMLVCRVIAGRVKKCEDEEGGGGGEEEYDSVAGAAGVYSNLDELYVINPRAILPCFVVIYSGF